MGRPDIDLHLDIGAGAGLRARSIESALREAVTSGRLSAGVRLPSTRSLADDLGIARGTVVAAYAQLVGEGWLVSVSGSGTRVADVLLPRASPQELPRRQALDLRPGRPDLSLFPHALWSAAVKRTLAAADHSSMDYGDPAGSRALREAVATYVSRARGVRAEAEAVVITSGFSHALAVLSRALRVRGTRVIATEEPGLARHRQLIHDAGLGTVGLRVGPDGADPAEIPAGTGAVLLTPAHQHPRGIVLSHDARTTFVDWANRHDRVVIEDDYDGEFRYDRQSVGVMQSLDPNRVVFAGSTSTTLAPGVRIGWLVLPRWLRVPVLDAIVGTGATVSAPDQLALADLLGRGDYDRHVRHTRRIYHRRRADLAARLTGIPFEGAAAGLHALLPLGSRREEQRLIRRGLAAGLQLTGLGGPHYRYSDDGRSGLVIGYATPPQHAWRPALDALTEVLDGAAVAPW